MESLFYRRLAHGKSLTVEEEEILSQLTKEDQFSTKLTAAKERSIVMFTVQPQLVSIMDHLFDSLKNDLVHFSLSQARNAFSSFEGAVYTVKTVGKLLSKLAVVEAFQTKTIVCMTVGININGCIGPGPLFWLLLLLKGLNIQVEKVEIDITISVYDSITVIVDTFSLQIAVEMEHKNYPVKELIDIMQTKMFDKDGLTAWFKECLKPFKVNLQKKLSNR